MLVASEVLLFLFIGCWRNISIARFDIEKVIIREKSHRHVHDRLSHLLESVAFRDVAVACDDAALVAGVVITCRSE